MLSVIVWLVFGWLIGSIAEWLYPPAKPHSKWATIAIGVGGSIAGGIVGSILGGSPYAPAGVLLSVLGALGVMYAYRKYSEV